MAKSKEVIDSAAKRWMLTFPLWIIVTTAPMSTAKVVTLMPPHPLTGSNPLDLKPATVQPPTQEVAAAPNISP